MTHAEFVELLYRSGVLTRSYPKHQYHNISREYEFFNSAQAYAQSIPHPQKEFHPESLLTQESAIRILDALSEK